MAAYIFFGACFLIAILICVVCSIRAEADFNKRFRPISDAEFLARCSPGIRPEVALGVRRVLAECLNVDYERIYPSSRIGADLGAE